VSSVISSVGAMSQCEPWSLIAWSPAGSAAEAARSHLCLLFRFFSFESVETPSSVEGLAQHRRRQVMHLLGGLTLPSTGWTSLPSRALSNLGPLAFPPR
jgi:hypothetical protein